MDAILCQDVCIMNIFSQFVTCSFLYKVFGRAKVLHFDKIQFINIFSYGLCFCIPGNFCLGQSSKDIFLCSLLGVLWF